MTWTSLVAPKGTAGSIMNWVNYTKLDVETVVDEAQSLLYQMLRVREMRATWTFGMAAGSTAIALPARFLDPIGTLLDITNNTRIPHRLESDILAARTYEPLTGSLGANPFTTVNGSSSVNVHKVGHGVTQNSVATFSGATAVGGFTFTGSYSVGSIVDADNYTIAMADDGVASSSATGGGSAITYEIDKLCSGFPSMWAIWDEQIKFDVGFDTATRFKLVYYRSPTLLSASNLSNWLTVRYPMLMRKACQAAAADFMKDDVEYKKGIEALSALIQSTAAENDLIYRGTEFGTDTP